MKDVNAVMQVMEKFIQEGPADLERAAVCYKLITTVKKEDQLTLLEFFFQKFRPVPGIEDDDSEQEGCYRKGIHDFLYKLQKEDVSEHEFYKRLWAIINSSVFPDDSTRIEVLFECALSRSTPYFQYSRTLSMSEDEYADILRQNLGSRTIARVESIMCTRLSQKTERMSLLVPLMENMDFKTKCVFLATVLTIQEQNLRKRFFMEQFLKDIERMDQEDD